MQAEQAPPSSAIDDRDDGQRGAPGRVVLDPDVNWVARGAPTSGKWL